MKTKKLKLSLETIRRLDLDATHGGYHVPQMRTRDASCGLGCILETDTIRPPENDTVLRPTRGLGASCGIDCMPGRPIHSRYTECI